MSRRCCLFLAAIFAALSIPAVSAQEPCSDSSKDARTDGYKLWTGTKGNYYTEVGRALTIAAAHVGIKIACRTSKGSVDNIYALENRQADFALIQSDASHLAWFGESPFTRKYSEIKLIAPLFTERVQILVRPHLYITSPAGLQRPGSVWMGPPTSGSELTALMVLQASGKTFQEAKNLEMKSDTAGGITFDQAVARLRTGDLDAVFQTEVAPTKRVADVLSNRDLEIRLLPFSLDSIDLLVKNGMYVESSIQQIDYPQVRGGIYTVGVEALLVARRGVDGDDIVTLARMLRDNPDDLELHLQQILAGDYEATSDPMGESPVSQKALSGLIDPSSMTLIGTQVPAPLLDHVDLNARNYLWKWPIRKEAALRIMGLSALLLVVCIVGLVHPGGRRLAGKNAKLIILTVACLVGWLVGGTWLQAVEGGLNQHFTTLTKSCLALAENVGAKVQLPFSPLPTPITREGTTIMTWFSWLGFLMLTSFAYPLAKKTWQNLRHLRGDSQSSS